MKKEYIGTKNIVYNMLQYQTCEAENILVEAIFQNNDSLIFLDLNDD